MPEPTRRTPDGIPIIPDKVADKIKAGKRNFSIEEVVGEKAVEAVVESSAGRGAPIHAESLTPISRDEAKRRTTFDGEHLPALPQTRRVIPAPFRRPVINMTVPGEPKRSWQHVRAEQVQVGDTVPDVGLVVDVKELVHREMVAGVPDVPVRVSVVLVGKGGQCWAGEPHEQVRAFRF